MLDASLAPGAGPFGVEPLVGQLDLDLAAELVGTWQTWRMVDMEAPATQETRSAPASKARRAILEPASAIRTSARICLSGKRARMARTA